eukprot:1087902-Pyramimonas_sp.AAC.1
MTDVGFDRPWARFMRAISVLDPQDVQMLGVEMDTADDGPTSRRPIDWDASFAEVPRKGVGASEVDGDADTSLAE